MSHLVFVITDSITNSVFDGQVLQPLLKHKQKNPDSIIHLISFERNRKHVKKDLHSDIAVTYFKLYPFFGTISLQTNIYKLHRYLEKLPPHILIARGPISGYISLRASQKTKCRQLTIQARGLLAEEYEYAKKETNFFLLPLHWVRKKLFKQLERSAYAVKQKQLAPLFIEAVSPALKDYLITQFDTNSNLITIAQEDTPQIIEKDVQMNWRQEVRNELEISSDVFVYVYNGSAKPWQRPDMVINFFVKKIDDQKKTFLLILTQDRDIFEQWLKTAQIPENHYRILNVCHKEIYRYLSAADAGLLFREPHIVNWVARPTKMLEYKAVGLPIIHNNTVAWLQNEG